MKQLRNALITINMKEKTITKEELETAVKLLDLDYFIGSLEKGEQGTLHWQCYLEKKTRLRFDQLHKNLFNCHIEVRKGTQQQAIDYIKKIGTKYDDGSTMGELIEIGLPNEEKSKSRNELEDVKDLILEENATYNDILLEFPNVIARYEKYVNQLLQYRAEKNFGKHIRSVTVYYIFGDSGTGKTKMIYDLYAYDDVYRVTDYNNGSFDKYRGQKVLVLDEFRSQFTISQMLSLLDIYPYELPCRYANKLACFTEIYIISNYSLSLQYANVQMEHLETWNAFKRRINWLMYFDKNWGLSEKQLLNETLEDKINGLADIPIAE